MRDTDYHSYWEENVAEWAAFYLDLSHGHEKLAAPGWLAGLYKASIGRLERRLMRERFHRTIAFLDRHARPGITLSDLGCGTGIFVVEALRRGAAVNAIDFSTTALDITRTNVKRYCPEGQVSYLRCDVQRHELPRSDVTLAMGLTPYLTDLSAFMRNALTKTSTFFCLYVDPRHPANRLRRTIPFLNVRGLQFHSRENVDRLYNSHDWAAVERRDFATGYIDLARTRSAAHLSGEMRS